MNPVFDRYTQYFGVEATGARIGLCTCRDCGAAIIIGDDPDAPTKHNEWHLKLEKEASK